MKIIIEELQINTQIENSERINKYIVHIIDKIPIKIVHYISENNHLFHSFVNNYLITPQKLVSLKLN